MTVATESKADLNYVRIRFSKSETGWAVKLSNGYYRINNLPFSGRLNIDDIVKCREESNELPIVVKIVTEGFPCKSAVAYQTVDQFRAFCKIAREHGCKTEGVIGPKEGEHGIVIVAHKRDFDPFAIAMELGVVNADHYHKPRKKRKK